MINKAQRDPVLGDFWTCGVELAARDALDRKTKIVSGHGKGLTEAQSRSSAIGEAFEGYAASTLSPSGTPYGTVEDIEGSVLDPEALVLYRESQYADLPFARYCRDTPLMWWPMRTLGSDGVTYIPAISVLMNYPMRSEQEYLFLPNSNGMATGKSLTEAVLAGAYEVLERDAFLLTWYNRLEAEVVDHRVVPHEASRRLVKELETERTEVYLFRLGASLCCHAFCCVLRARHKRAPALAFGSGADLNAVEAVKKALLEAVQMRRILERRLADAATRERMVRLGHGEIQPTRPSDHSLLYAHPGHAGAWAFLRGSPGCAEYWDDKPPTSAKKRLGQLSERLMQEGLEILYADLTPKEIAAHGYQVVRVVIPGVQPIDYGVGERRFGGNRLHAAASLLNPCEQTSSHVRFNPHPHPIG